MILSIGTLRPLPDGAGNLASSSGYHVIATEMAKFETASAADHVTREFWTSGCGFR